ncbi:MAG: VIT1/CCC1 transporter family protein [Candidatus Peregrinibacteria bacterium]|nr:VIT1/CCC1 transporter family protein [Candidatus Peregrinibacteria bacterium]
MVERIAANMKDMILGGQDGLVNVLGVILGIAAATSDMRIILAGGFAATFAESISMAAVAYTSTIASVDYYESTKKNEERSIEENPEMEIQKIRDVYAARGFEGDLLDQIVTKITSDKTRWVEVMMLEELRLSPATKNGALWSALIVGLSAMVGSFVPLVPFFFFSVKAGVIVSLIVSSLALFGAGAFKAKITVGYWLKSGIQMLVIGLVSALLGYYIGYLFS